jgi:hypothetical protein
MLTNWIPKESLAALNDGFVVAIMLEAKEGESGALAEILQVMTAPNNPRSMTTAAHTERASR